MTVQASRAGFLAAHRAAMVDFFEDMMRVIRWYRDPANHDAALHPVDDRRADIRRSQPCRRSGQALARADALLGIKASRHKPRSA
jgi:ABC-type nitrate/sulfonate/bicarbonate transport system substrate-binding protein